MWIREAFGVNSRYADHRDLKLVPDGARMTIASGLHERLYRYAKISNSRDSDRVARDELAGPLANQAAGVLEWWLLSLLDAAVFVHFAIAIIALHSRLAYCNQIGHIYSDRYGTDSNLNKIDQHNPRGDFRGLTIQKDGWTDGRTDGRTDWRTDGWTDGRMDGRMDG